MTQTIQRPWYQRWIVQPIKNQLTQGITPEKLGWTTGAGIAAGIFPIMGTTTIVSALVAWVFRLNQPVMHIFKTMVYPLHLALILVFIRLGERMHGAELIKLSIPQLLERFKESPAQFAQDFGLAAWHGVTAWALVAPFIVVTGRIVTTPIFHKMKSYREARA